MQRVVTVWVVLCLAAGAASAADMSWVEKSNEHAQVVLSAFAKLAPEGAASMGVDGLDENITDLSPGLHERSQRIIKEVIAELEHRLADEQDTKVRQDLEILLKASKDSMRSQELDHENMLPYINVNQSVFRGIRALIDPQVSRDRYPSAVVRIEKYAGLAEGYEPFTELAKKLSQERFDVEGLVGPYRGEVEQDLERAETPRLL